LIELKSVIVKAPGSNIACIDRRNQSTIT